MENFQPLEILLVQFVEFLPKLITSMVIFIIALFASSWLRDKHVATVPGAHFRSSVGSGIWKSSPMWCSTR